MTVKGKLSINLESPNLLFEYSIKIKLKKLLTRYYRYGSIPVSSIPSCFRKKNLATVFYRLRRQKRRYWLFIQTSQVDNFRVFVIVFSHLGIRTSVFSSSYFHVFAFSSSCFRDFVFSSSYFHVFAFSSSCFCVSVFVVLCFRLRTFVIPNGTQ